MHLIWSFLVAFCWLIFGYQHWGPFINIDWMLFVRLNRWLTGGRNLWLPIENWACWSSWIGRYWLRGWARRKGSVRLVHLCCPRCYRWKWKKAELPSKISSCRDCFLHPELQGPRCPRLIRPSQRTDLHL